MINVLLGCKHIYKLCNPHYWQCQLIIFLFQKFFKVRFRLVPIKMVVINFYLPNLKIFQKRWIKFHLTGTNKVVCIHKKVSSSYWNKLRTTSIHHRFSPNWPLGRFGLKVTMYVTQCRMSYYCIQLFQKVFFLGLGCT